MGEPDLLKMHASARATAERLLANQVPSPPTPESAISGAERVFAHLFRNLSQWVGAAGCQALFSRALLLSVDDHAVWEGVRYRAQGGTPHFDRLAENARTLGVAATVEGVTVVLTSIITMLTGLIGDEDIAMSLLEDRRPGPDRSTLGNTPLATSSSDDGGSHSDRRHGHDRRSE